MATAVKMPQKGLSEESAIIAQWHKKKGDSVKIGDVLFSIETDKSTFDVESEVEGTILEIFYQEGDEVPVLSDVCVIGDKDAQYSPANVSLSDTIQQAEVLHEPKEISKKVVNATDTISNPIDSLDNDKIKISPRAKHLAQKMGIDFSYAAGTGPEGRIIERDIVAMMEKGPFVTSAAKEEYMQSGSENTIGTGIGGKITTSDLQQPVMPEKQPVHSEQSVQDEYEERALNRIRKVIAKNMHHSLSSTAQLTLNTSFDATDILAYRKKLKISMDRLGLHNITINDIILYAVSRTLLNHKELNAHFLDDKMHIFHNVHLGVAVDTERGLMVPTVLNANKKSLNEISGEVKILAEECQKGTINPDMLKGGSFTVTNLGSLGIESFTPVLNPPQTGILGVNTITQNVKEVNGEIVYYPSITLSLTFDHRALDGAPAARFLKELKTNLENFSILLAK
ncbi:MAG: hypothetical protein PWQ70_509 [Clostridiales bacterium]|jgi:pyruvate dehydrogenase E2 component (dihydrolipoamide acetyltransferase)|nr:hypothetical protein [Clostridiales bacterium]